MSPSDTAVDGQADHGNSLYAALARTLTRSAALYFSRPVRLFRPVKGAEVIPTQYLQYLLTLCFIPVSGWMFLQGLATQKGVSLSPQFLSYLVKKHGVSILTFPFLTSVFLSDP